MTKITMAKMVDGKKIRAVIEIEVKSKTPCAPYMRTDHKVFDANHRFLELSICGSLTGGGHSCGGQCIDEIAEVFSDDPNVQTIRKIWKRYHLNGMHAGCIHQKSGPSSDKEIMNQVCSREVVNTKGPSTETSTYKYGSAWLFEEIPGDVLAELETAMSGLKGPAVPTHAEDFAKKHDITLASVKVHENPNMEGGKDMSHYQVRLTRKIGYNQEKKFVTFFSMGSAHKKGPTLNDILPCLAMDAATREFSFEDFCSNYGYDSDSRKAKQIYNTTLAQTKKLESFLGDAFEELLEITE
jgi:hypothetical protein